MWLRCSIMVQSRQTELWQDSQYSTSFSFLWTLQNNGLASSPGRHERTSSNVDSWWSTVSRDRRWAVVQKLHRNFRHSVHLDTGGSLLMQFSQLIWLTEELSSAMTVSMFCANRLVCKEHTPSPGICCHLNENLHNISWTIKYVTKLLHSDWSKRVLF